MMQIREGRDFLFDLKDLRKYLQSRNISLIGMSGAGKTTLGTVLSRRYNKRFVDTDQVISEVEGMSINRIFSQYGEEKFRLLETECVRQVSKYNNVVISTGGGVIIKEENMKLLKSRSFIVFIHRDIDNIIKYVDASRRPLLRNSPDIIKDLYYKRIRLYIDYADVIINNNGNMADMINMTDRKLMDILEVL
jgi:shikimate kinase